METAEPSQQSPGPASREAHTGGRGSNEKLEKEAWVKNARRDRLLPKYPLARRPLGRIESSSIKGA